MSSRGDQRRRRKTCGRRRPLSEEKNGAAPRGLACSRRGSCVQIQSHESFRLYRRSVLDLQLAAVLDFSSGTSLVQVEPSGKAWNPSCHCLHSVHSSLQMCSVSTQKAPFLSPLLFLSTLRFAGRPREVGAGDSNGLRCRRHYPQHPSSLRVVWADLLLFSPIRSLILGNGASITNLDSIRVVLRRLHELWTRCGNTGISLVSTCSPPSSSAETSRLRKQRLMIPSASLRTRKNKYSPHTSDLFSIL